MPVPFGSLTHSNVEEDDIHGMSLTLENNQENENGKLASTPSPVDLSATPSLETPQHSVEPDSPLRSLLPDTSPIRLASTPSSRPPVNLSATPPLIVGQVYIGPVLPLQPISDIPPQNRILVSLPSPNIMESHDQSGGQAAGRAVTQIGAREQSDSFRQDQPSSRGTSADNRPSQSTVRGRTPHSEEAECDYNI